MAASLNGLAPAAAPRQSTNLAVQQGSSSDAAPDQGALSFASLLQADTGEPAESGREPKTVEELQPEQGVEVPEPFLAASAPPLQVDEGPMEPVAKPSSSAAMELPSSQPIAKTPARTSLEAANAVTEAADDMAAVLRPQETPAKGAAPVATSAKAEPTTSVIPPMTASAEGARSPLLAAAAQLPASTQLSPQALHEGSQHSGTLAMAATPSALTPGNPNRHARPTQPVSGIQTAMAARAQPALAQVAHSQAHPPPSTDMAEMEIALPGSNQPVDAVLTELAAKPAPSAEPQLAFSLSTAPLGSLSTAALGSATAVPAAALPNSLNLQDANWTGALGQELVQLRQAGEQSLRLALAPDHLGHMELELRQLSDGSLELRMQAESPQARDLLLAQSAELRDKLQGQGMSLSHFSCTSDGQREAAQRQETGSSQALAGQSIQGSDEEPSLDTQQTAISSMGLHLYA